MATENDHTLFHLCSKVRPKIFPLSELLHTVTVVVCNNYKAVLKKQDEAGHVNLTKTL